MATLYKRGNTWWVAYFVGGRRVQQSLKTANKTLAAEAVKVIEGDMVRLTHGLPVARARAHDVVAAYLKDIAADGFHRRYLRAVQARLEAFLEHTGVKLMSDLTPPVVQKYLTHRKQAHGLNRAYRDYGYLRSFLKWAQTSNFITTNPIDRVKSPKKPAKEPIRFLSHEEAARLLAAADGRIVGGNGARRPRTTPLKEMISLGLYAGLRRGEILALCWEHINWKDGFLVIVKTKSNKYRTVPMHQALAATLAAYRKQVGQSQGLVFQTRTGNPFMETNMGRVMRNLAQAAGLERIGWNVLRHTAASWAVQEGESLFKVSKFLGHSDTRVTEEHYAQLAPKHLRSVVDRMRAVDVAATPSADDMASTTVLPLG